MRASGRHGCGRVRYEVAPPGALAPALWLVVTLGMANAGMVPPAGFDDLPVDEQIDYVNFLWDRIFVRGKEEPSVPEWHMELLRERVAAHDANPDAGELWEDVYAELLDEFGKSR
jgi:putative addiction module component (TIGR02574 family)